MNKAKFVETAPIYYAIAICSYFGRYGSPAYRDEITDFFYVPESEENAEYAYLQHNILFARAISWLQGKGVIEALEDHFGPSIYRPTSDFDILVDAFARDSDLPFYNYAASRKGDSWLKSALVNVNETYIALGMGKEDFDNPDSEWQPLPLDRSDPALSAAVNALDIVVEQVRGDNGYNATIPEERNYVLSTLSEAVKTLKREASTNVQYIKVFVLEPLGLVLSRFKDAAIGITAAAAKSAVIEFLKQHGIKLLGTFFG